MVISDTEQLLGNFDRISPRSIATALLIFRSFKPSPELISELMLINKVLVSVNLVPESEASFDLVVSADLLLTGHPNEDAINVAVILTTIADVHTELYNRFESM